VTGIWVVCVGGSDAGIAAALRARELDPDSDVTVVLSDAYPNFSICGIPYLVSREVGHWRDLAHRTTEHLRQAWTPLTFTDQNRPEPTDPVATARRSAAADRKTATKTTTDQLPAHSFTNLLDHLATLTRNEIRFLAVEGQPVIDQLALPTPTQRRAFELLAQPIPLTLK
jgi:hypothetical protein